MRFQLPAVGTLLLGSYTVLHAAAQMPLPPGQITPESLNRFCSAQPATGCVIPLAGDYTLHLTGDWQVPHGMHLQFGAGSTLHVADGLLDFAGGTVDAPPTLLFPDAGHVRGLAAARPEWFASSVSPGPVPASAMADAYAATQPWGTIYLQARPYLSPFGDCPAVTPRMPFDSPRTLVGAGRPTPDSPTAPTHLQGGTTIVGGIFGHAALRMAHLGVDVGPQVSAAVLAGCQPAGIFIEQPLSRQFVSGDRLEDVSVLSTGAFNMHSAMFAGHSDVQIQGLWIWTLGGTHGLVMKSEHSIVDGLHCWGAVSDCLIVKSDYATDLLGRAVEDRVSHVEIAPLHPGRPVGGIVVESTWDVVRSLTMDDLHETGTQFAIVLRGSTFYRPRNITINNWTSDATTDTCLFDDKADHVQISGFACNLEPAALAGFVLRGSRNTQIENGTIRCDGQPAACAAGKTAAIADDARNTTLSNVDVRGLGGSVLLYTGQPPALGGVHAPGMGGRLAARFPVTLLQRIRDALIQTKPNLRILYDTVAVRVRYAPLAMAAVAGLLSVLAGYEWIYRRRSKARLRETQGT